MKQKIINFFLAALVIFPLTALADDSTTIINPIPDVTDIKGLILKILSKIFEYLSIVAVLMIVIAGFRMVASSGSEDQVKKAKQMIYNSVFGLIVALLAYSIIAIVQNLLIK